VNKFKILGIAVVTALALTAFAGAGTALAAAPVNTGLPAISPSAPIEGTKVTTSNGKWSGSPTAFSYKWQRCNAAGAECAYIEGATLSTYTPTATDVGKTLVSRVTAYNEEGNTSVFSKPTAVVRPIGEIKEYALPEKSYPVGIAFGWMSKPWFSTEEGVIGHISTSGTELTEYTLPGFSCSESIDDHPADTKMWFTNGCANKVGKISTTGVITEYALPAGSGPGGITAGPIVAGNANMWFVNNGTDKVAKITSTGVITEYALPAKSDPVDIVTGSDKNLWFTNGGTGKIGKITPAGVITEYALPAGSHPVEIAADPSGDLWFTDFSNKKVSKITTAGTVTEYSVAAGSPRGVTVDGGGRPWFTIQQADLIGKLEANGTVRTFSLPAGSAPTGIDTGAGGLLWFANTLSSKIGSITS